MHCTYDNKKKDFQGVGVLVEGVNAMWLWHAASFPLSLLFCSNSLGLTTSWSVKVGSTNLLFTSYNTVVLEELPS